jgi:hypothetical protein
MPSLDLMTESELIAQLHQLADDCARLDCRIAYALQRQKFAQNPGDAAEAKADEQAMLTEMSRLMDRMRATEGHLMRVRGRLCPLHPHEPLVS